VTGPRSKSAVGLHLILDSEVQIQAVQCVVQLSSWNRMGRIHGILLTRHRRVCCRVLLVVRFKPKVEKETLGASYGACLGRLAGIAAVIGLPFIFLIPYIFPPLLQLSVFLKAVSMTALFVAISYLGICNCKFCVHILFLKLLKLCVNLPFCTLWGQLKQRKCVLSGLFTCRTTYKGFCVS